ncbi:MAG TPA: hypothetical protein ENK25_00415 [Bacteroidetes bacterium]|nr:hypothetical protein [Bacteroidota bacterium]
MSQFLLFLFKVLVAIGFISIFVISVVFIRPLRINKLWPRSTLFLKFSYLTYLLVILVFFYYLIFQEKELVDVIDIRRFFMLLGCLFIPNVGMLVRRKMKKWRSRYNYLLGIIHLLVIYYLASLFVMIENYTGPAIYPL